MGGALCATGKRLVELIVAGNHNRVTQTELRAQRIGQLRMLDDRAVIITPTKPGSLASSNRRETVGREIPIN